MQNQKHLGKYEILGEIGKGGFATVYRARDTVLGREVALKVLDPLLMRDEAFVERFKREAQAAAALRHPHIITIHDLGEAGGRLYIAMELIEEADLGVVTTQRGRVPWDETLRIVGQIAGALAYAHGRSLVHRDLKPANVLLDPQRGVVVTDFGFAKALGSSSASLTISGGVVGTPAYIPPEIWDGEEATPATDVYALACLTYEMLTGQPLFSGATPSATMRRHFQPPGFPEQWPPGVPDGVEDVFAAALEQNPVERTADPIQFVAALRELAAVSEPELSAVEPEPPALEPIPEAPEPAAPQEPQPDLVRPTTPKVQRPPAPPRASKPKSKLGVWVVGGVAILVILCCFVWAVVPGIFSGGESTVAQVTNTPSPSATVRPTNTPRPTTAPTPIPTPTSSPTKAPTPAPGDVVLAESFSGSDSEARWSLRETDDYIFRIEDGKMIAVGSDPDGFAWTKSTDSYSSLDLQVEATILEGDTEAIFGTGFAIDSSGDNWKACLVQGDDSAYCGEKVSGELDWGDWVSVDLSSEDDANVMRLIVADRKWALYVNTQCVGSGETHDARQRPIGLLVSTASESSAARIEYDNLTIRVPDDDSRELLACEPRPYTSGGGAPSGGGGAGSGNGILQVSNQIAGVGCHLEFWGPTAHTIDVGTGDTRRVETVPGEYGWRAFIGGRETGQADTAKLGPGGVCSFTCMEDGDTMWINWGCNP